MDWKWLVLVAAAVLFATSWFIRRTSGSGLVPTKFTVGPLTLQALVLYAGYDYSRPILVAIKGKIYDVTNAADQFGPGKPLHVYAGREVARALAKGSTAPEDLGSDVVHDLSQAQAEVLAAAQAEYDKLYDAVGQVVPMQELSLAQLAQHDGVAQPGAPLLLAIKGTIFDVSRGSAFYGPEGMYPFAGKECARALALMSTEESDCTDVTDDLGAASKDTLAEWVARFSSKYPIVGKVVPAKAVATDK